MIKDPRDLNYIIFRSSVPVDLTNARGRNYDHRRADHCPVRLMFLREVPLTEGKDYFTMDELVRAYFDTCSHKFDGSYELYCDSEIEFPYFFVKNERQRIVISNIHDHGS